MVHGQVKPVLLMETCPTNHEHIFVGTNCNGSSRIRLAETVVAYIELMGAIDPPHIVTTATITP